MTETSLSTRCPQCQTRFRLTSEQLAVRDGMVRCGACRHVFNGRTQPEPNNQVIAAFAETAGPTDDIAESADLKNTASNAEASASLALTDFTLLQGGRAPDSTPAAAGGNMQEELDSLSKAIADLQAKPWQPPVETDSETADGDDGEPGFIQAARKKQRGARTWKILLRIGLPLLLLALAAQLTYYFRSEMSARVPQAAPLLNAACARLACAIDLPAEINALSLQSSQLQAVPGVPDQFELVALLRNQSQTVQAWPALELLLKDEQGQAQVRKVLLPAAFLTQQEKASGMEARSEREVRVHFSLTNAQAADFQLTLFYP